MLNGKILKVGHGKTGSKLLRLLLMLTSNNDATWDVDEQTWNTANVKWSEALSRWYD